MKHLRLYEELEDIILGDYIVLLYPDSSDLAFGFKRGEMYKINFIFKSGESPYQVKNNGLTTSLSRYQFRKATAEDIAMNKYNI